MLSGPSRCHDTATETGAAATVTKGISQRTATDFELNPSNETRPARTYNRGADLRSTCSVHENTFFSVYFVLFSLILSIACYSLCRSIMSALREDLLEQAVRFLQDPKAAESPLAQRLQFLESKGLTELEIAEAIKQSSLAGSSSTSTASNPPRSAEASAPPRPTYYPGQAYQPAPPPLPTRDWKDVFVMATASVGVTYGLYILAKVECLLNSQLIAI